MLYGQNAGIIKKIKAQTKPEKFYDPNQQN